MRSRLQITFVLILCSLLFSIGINMFLVPSQVVSGGFTGIAHILNIMFDMPIGIVVIFLNIPFLLINARLFGKSFFKKAVLGVILSGIMTELFKFRAILNDRFINAVLGGAVLGVSMGIMFTLGYTTGGTDFIASIVREKNKRISIGTAIFLGDLIIILLAFAVTRDTIGVLLAIISIFVQTRAIDITMKRLTIM